MGIDCPITFTKSSFLAALRIHFLSLKLFPKTFFDMIKAHPTVSSNKSRKTQVPFVSIHMLHIKNINEMHLGRMLNISAKTYCTLLWIHLLARSSFITSENVMTIPQSWVARVKIKLSPTKSKWWIWGACWQIVIPCKDPALSTWLISAKSPSTQSRNRYGEMRSPWRSPQEWQM